MMVNLIKIKTFDTIKSEIVQTIMKLEDYIDEYKQVPPKKDTDCHLVAF